MLNADMSMHEDRNQRYVRQGRRPARSMRALQKQPSEFFAGVRSTCLAKRLEPLSCAAASHDDYICCVIELSSEQRVQAQGRRARVTFILLSEEAIA
jgi:hypothetical protein